MIGPRTFLAAGAFLLLRAAITVVRGRRALAAAGAAADAFSPPWTAVAQLLLGALVCLVSLCRHSGGLKPIRQLGPQKMDWDALHDRPGFRCMYTRLRYAAPILRKAAAAAAGEQQQQQQQRHADFREKKRQ